MREFPEIRTLMEEKASGKYNFNGGKSFGGAHLQWRRELWVRERVSVVVKGKSKNMNERGVWIQR